MNVGVTSRRIRCRGSELSVRVHGQGPPILLLHGWPQTSRAWDPLAQQLTAAGWQVVAPDLLGTGESERAADGYGKDDQAEAMAELIHQLGLATPLPVVGHDIGGMIAFSLARRHPELLDRLVLADLALPGLGLEQAMDVAHGGLWHFGLFLQADVPAMIISGHEPEFFSYWFAFQAGDVTSLPVGSIEAYTRSYTGRDALDASFGHYRTLLDDGRVNRAWVEAGGRLDLPVLAIGGELSAGTQLAESIRPVCPQVCVSVIAGAGHFVAEERTEEFWVSLRDFLNTQASARTSPARF